MLTPWRNAAVASFQAEPTDQIGHWEPIVSRDELERCRAILLAKRGERRTPKHLLSGLVFYECGEPMTGCNRNGKPH